MIAVCLSSDISNLLVPQPLPKSTAHADDGLMKAGVQSTPQEAANNPVVITAVAGSVAAAMLVATMLVILRMRRRRQESDEVVIVQDTPGFTEVSLSLSNLHHGNLGWLFFFTVTRLCFSR